MFSLLNSTEGVYLYKSHFFVECNKWHRKRRPTPNRIQRILLILLMLMQEKELVLKYMDEIIADTGLNRDDENTLTLS